MDFNRNTIMSIYHSLQIVINTVLDTLCVERVLARAESMGCTFMSEASDRMLDKTSLQEMVNGIMSQLDNDSQQDNSPLKRYASITVNYLGTVVFLSFSEREKYCNLSLFVSGGKWYFQDDFLDFARYIPILFSLSQDYEILWLKTCDEGEDEDLYHRAANLYPEFQPQEHIQPRQQRVDVTLLVNDTISHVREMVEKSQARGIQFFAQNKTLPLQELSVDVTINLLLNSSMAQGFPELIQRANYPVLCKVADQWYALVIGVRSTARAFSLIRVNPPEPSAQAVSFNTAIYHAIDLCKDFCIVELVTFDTWYNVYKLLPQYQP